MGSALGGTLATRDRGFRVVDIRDFGAVAGGNSTTNRIAIQAAIDSLATTVGNVSGGVVYIPTGRFQTDRTIFIDADYVKIVGDGRYASKILGPNGPDTFVLGVKRKPGGAVLPLDHVVDMYTAGAGGTPILDSGAVSSAGQRWGLRMFGDHHLAGQGNAFDLGVVDWYGQSSQLTVDIALDLSNAAGTGNYPVTASVMGLSEGPNQMPFTLLVRNSQFRVSFRTKTNTGVDTGVNRSFAFGSTTTTNGFARITFQIDLDTATVAAWINGVQQTILIPSNLDAGSGFVAATGLKFVSNQHCPFCINSNTYTIVGIADQVGSSFDWTLFGLKITCAPIYAVGAAGSAQARLDAAAITDLKRYFTNDQAQLVGYMPLQDSPATLQADRLVSVKSGAAGGNATTKIFFLDNDSHGSPYLSYTSATEFRDLSITSSSAYFGRPVAIGMVTNLRVSDCDLIGGLHGIGAHNSGASYPIYVKNCTLQGYDGASHFHYSSYVHLSNIVVQGNHRCAFRLHYSYSTMEQVFIINGGGDPEYFVKGNRSSYDLYQGAWDAESVQGNLIAAFYTTPGNATPIDGVVNIENTVIARIPYATTVIYLDDLVGVAEENNFYRHATFSCTNLSFHGDSGYYPRAVVRTNSPRWQGEIRAEIELDRPNWVENGGGARGTVISRHYYNNSPPRNGTWEANCHILEANNPALSQYTQWRCLASGIYGTATPPRWQGFHPLDDGLSLAAYIADNTYWSQTGAPPGSQGFWKNTVHNRGLSAFFGGTAIVAPTLPLRAGLSASGAIRWKLYRELTVGTGGYARVNLPSSPFTTCSNGVMSNAQAIVFPTATADWQHSSGDKTIRSIVITDTAGLELFAVDVTPFTVASGDTPTFGVGTLALAPSASSGQGLLATGVHDRIANLYLNGATLSPPTIYLALSTRTASLSVSPVEPSGGSYARVVTSAASWTTPPNLGNTAPGPARDSCVIRNAVNLTFPAPTGDWGMVQSVYLMDAPSGGSVLGAADLVIPRTISSGSPARAFVPGALCVNRS